MWIATYGAKNSPSVFRVHVEEVDSCFRIKQVSGVRNIAVRVKDDRSILIHSYIFAV